MKNLNNKYWPKQFNSVDIVLSNLKRDSYGLETDQKNSSDNSYFISKIANVTNKINTKYTMFKFFRLWKKKSKE